jgi:2-polyprenyl-3-methyl-5-hydroxy-6-metoxy-1,4-benzoquinol methylase
MKKITTTKVKYIHTEAAHNTHAASIVAPIVNELLHGCLPPMERRSIVDFGCGLGTWLKVFKEHGAARILGLDGKWVNRELLFKNIAEHEFRYVDLEAPIALGQTFDLAVSLEVAEHVSEHGADAFVQSLCNASRVILFSAAIPGQGGFNHINEQFPSYWMAKFKKHGYVFHDIVRSKIWNNSEIEIHYRQNMFIVAHESVNISETMLNDVKNGGG